MRIGVFSTKSYDKRFLGAANSETHELSFLEPRLTAATAPLAAGFDGVCVFVNDELCAETLQQLHALGVRLVALRCAGFNNVDVRSAQKLGITVVRVPAYSPEAVAEYTIALLLTLTRKIHKAFSRVREGNFTLEGLLGYDVHNKTCGVMGTGKIGIQVCRVLKAFGCEVLASDPFPNDVVRSLGVEYVSPSELLSRSDIISLHAPLTPETRHFINRDSLRAMKPGVLLINTGRGGLIDARATIEGLKSGRIGGLAMDVYEEEDKLFFEDLSNEVLLDDIFARLLTFPNVIVTGHQAFFSQEAMENISSTTIANITEFERTGSCRNMVRPVE